jgi:2-dehydro-3-deoxygluconokinase
VTRRGGQNRLRQPVVLGLVSKAGNPPPRRLASSRGQVGPRVASPVDTCEPFRNFLDMTDHRVFDLATLGETMTLFLTEPPVPLRHAHTFVRSIAGAESNVAVGVTRLGLTASWCGRVGGDALGLAVLDSLRTEGVDTSRAIVDVDGWTGVLVRDRHLERRVNVAYARRGSAGSALGPADVDADWVGSARVIHLTGITPALSATAAAAVERALELASAAGVDVSFDVNFRRRLWTEEEAGRALQSLVPRVSVLFATEEEIAVLSGKPDAQSAADWALGSGVQTVVIKRGAEGAIGFRQDAAVEAAGYRVLAVDPVGAGDAFVAGYLAAMLMGEDLSACLDQGCRAGAAGVQVPGDIEGLPWRSDGFSDHAARPEVDR